MAVPWLACLHPLSVRQWLLPSVGKGATQLLLGLAFWTGRPPADAKVPVFALGHLWRSPASRRQRVQRA
ncbi:hypothetical protein CBC3_01475 [Clostridium botulinum V891]|nr:hypothetical protein CBC3_01475 [Clostridium botulinum V891]